LIRRALVIVVPALSLGACGDGGGGAAEDSEPVRTNRVVLPKSYRFEPQAIEVEAGATVTWVNEDDFPHNVTLLDGSDVSRALPVGGSATISFEEAGEVPYECSLHPQQMQGRVVVV
jgi:plastocyanin